MAEGVGIDSDVVAAFAKTVWRAGDEMAALRMDSVLLQGAGACDGTALVAGLKGHAYEQHMRSVRWQGSTMSSAAP